MASRSPHRASSCCAGGCRRRASCACSTPCSTPCSTTRCSSPAPSPPATRCRPTRAWWPGSRPPCSRSARYTLAPEDTARFIARGAQRQSASGDRSTSAAGASSPTPEPASERIPGIGHPLLQARRPASAASLKQIAVEEGLWSERAELYELVHRHFVEAIGKPDIPINDVGMMAVVLLELGFTPEEMTGLAVLSTMPGVIAHISEELRVRAADPHRARRRRRLRRRGRP